MEKKKIEVAVDFTIGDKAWLRVSPHYREKSEKCPACKGTGKIVALDNQLYQCPCCKGSKKLLKGTQDGYNAVEGEVVGIYFKNLQIGKDTASIPPSPEQVMYDMKYCNQRYKPVPELFHSQKEAEGR